MIKGPVFYVGNIAVGAKESFVPTANDKADFVDVNQLTINNLSCPNYKNPCETYAVPLNNSALVMPPVPTLKNMGYVSDQISNEDGAFTQPITLELASDTYHSSPGITLTFDEYSNIYANEITIGWYRDNELVAYKSFNPDNYFYYCQNDVDNYNGVVITFFGLNMPGTRLRLTAIDYGDGLYFASNELKDVKITEEIDPTSAYLYSNIAEVKVETDRSVEDLFKENRPVNIYYDGVSKISGRIVSAKKESKKHYRLKIENEIGMLDYVLYNPSAMFFEENAAVIIKDILDQSNVNYRISEKIYDIGGVYFFPKRNMTCREALKNVLFAIGAVAMVSQGGVIYITKLENTVSQLIPSDRIFAGKGINYEKNLVNSVEIVCNTYKLPLPVPEQGKTYTSYDDWLSTYDWVEIDSKLASKEAITSPINYRLPAEYDQPVAYWSGILSVNKYGETFGLYQYSNPKPFEVTIDYLKRYTDICVSFYKAGSTVSAICKNEVSEGENFVAETFAYIPDTLEQRARTCFEYLSKGDGANVRIVEGKHVDYSKKVKYSDKAYGTFLYGEESDDAVTYDTPVNLGDIVTLNAVGYIGVITGMVVKMTYTLNGSILVKDVTIK